MMGTTRDEAGKRTPPPYTCNILSITSSFTDLVTKVSGTPVEGSTGIHHSPKSHSTAHSMVSNSTIKAENEDMHQEDAQVCCEVSSTPTTPVQESSSRSRPSIAILLAFVGLCLSIFLVALDTVLIPTALPTIALSFHVRDSLYAWIGSAYLLANAASVPFWGKVSDIFGRKSVILAADLIFLVGSIICALSVNAVMLVAGRVVQGFGGGGVVVLVHVCVSDLFSIRYVCALMIYCPKYC
jgi:hypothetical protein